MVEQEMKREMGKWLMDVAKYMFTALLISTIFADMEEPIVIYIAVVAAFILLFWGWTLYGSILVIQIKERTNDEYNSYFRLVGCFCYSSRSLLHVSR
jgi:hypothetical protein